MKMAFVYSFMYAINVFQAILFRETNGEPKYAKMLKERRDDS